jgi:hypothetical protein
MENEHGSPPTGRRPCPPGRPGPRGSSGSIQSIGSSGSILSIGSSGSILSIGSAGSILSIGSAGSVLSIGSVWSLGSVLSVASVASLGSGLSALSRWSVLAWRASGPPAVGRRGMSAPPRAGSLRAYRRRALRG